MYIVSFIERFTQATGGKLCDMGITGSHFKIFPVRVAILLAESSEQFLIS